MPEEPDNPNVINMHYRVEPGDVWYAMSMQQEYDQDGNPYASLGVRWRMMFGTNVVRVLSPEHVMIEPGPGEPPKPALMIPIDQFTGAARLRVARLIFRTAGEVPLDNAAMTAFASPVLLWRAADVSNDLEDA